jgi:hypothetical protein
LSDYNQAIKLSPRSHYYYYFYRGELYRKKVNTRRR